MVEELDILKKKILYRASYRGTKELDILLSNFVNKHINTFNRHQLIQLEAFLKLEDEIILNFYNNNIIADKIDENEISVIFKNFRI